jgi:hypothetical protein
MTDELFDIAKVICSNAIRVCQFCGQIEPIRGVLWGLQACEPCFVMIQDDAMEIYNDNRP